MASDQRGPQYEVNCARWESLTHEDIWGTPTPPPLPPIAAPAEAVARAAESLAGLAVAALAGPDSLVMRCELMKAMRDSWA